MPGLLVLNGGDEFHPGNEPQDQELIAAAASGPSYFVPTAAARQRPELAVATGRRWFSGLGLEVGELPIYNRRDAGSRELAERASRAGLLYLTGGDPGLVARVLAGSLVWRAMLDAWEAGAALAGSSAGAMALCDRTLVMARWPHHHERRAVPALGLIPATVLIPHYERFGPRWQVGDLPAQTTLLGVDERTAAVCRDSGCRALGAGGVSVVTGSEKLRFEGGQACRRIPPPDLAGARARAQAVSGRGGSRVTR
jgi:cyanophycinase